MRLLSLPGAQVVVSGAQLIPEQQLPPSATQRVSEPQVMHASSVAQQESPHATPD